MIAVVGVVGGGRVFFVGVGVGVGGSGGVWAGRDVLDGGIFEDCDGCGFLAADFDRAAAAGHVGLVLGAEVEGGLVFLVMVVGRRTEVGCCWNCIFIGNGSGHGEGF